jgi:ComF family protein
MWINYWLHNALGSIVDAVIPPRLSERRMRMLTIEALHEIARRQTDPAYAPTIRALMPYRNPAVKALIYELKYRQNPRALELATTLLREELLGMSEERLGTALLIPVPMHADRRRERGYNQTELLCQQLAVLPGIGLQYAPQALTRIQMGKPQQKLSRAARLQNMQGAMRAESAIVQKRLCIVIDDVSTTGATLTECRRALRRAGARDVHLVALAA